MPNKCYLLRQFYEFRFDSPCSLEENVEKYTKLIQDLVNYDGILSDDQQVVALLNSLSEEYKDIRNTLEYRRENLTVDIIIFALKNKEFELKTKFKDYKIDEKLYIKEKLIQSKKINRCNFNSFKKGKSLNQKFKDKNKNQVKTKNYVRKCYYFGKA